MANLDIGWHHGNMNLFADASAGPGKSFLLPFRQLEVPEYNHLAKGSLAQTEITVASSNQR